jgi:hypothetical protein
MRSCFNSFRLLIVFIFLTSLSACNKFDFWDHHPNDKNPGARVALDWYTLQLQLLLERNSTLNSAYFGYMGVGLYESVQPGIKNSISFSSKLYQMPAMPPIEQNKSYDWQVSANAAMASFLRYYNVGLTPANLVTIDSLENAYNQRLKHWTSDAAFTRSQAFGRSIATAVYNWSLTDNFNPSNAGYVPPVFFGAWVPTPPALANGIQPYIGVARPFLASSKNSVAGGFPFKYSEDPKSDYYKMVKKVYDVNKSLTDEQKNIALFWVDQGNGVGFTPPGHDFSVVTQAIAKKHCDLGTAAEAYAKAGIAEREASILCFKAKYKYNVMRPVTYIQHLIEPGWLPFIPTPPHPEYPAGHAFITGTVMEAVEKVLGEHLSITDHTYDFRGWAPRSYDNLFAAAQEAGISRLYGGIHHKISIDIGLKLAYDLGTKVGNLKVRY